MATKPFTPTMFGKYYLTERIAAGGMAEVYRAVLRGAAGFEKTVALKRILPVFGDEQEFVQLFQDEARIASTLTHTNIAQTFDFGEVDGSFYLTLELVDGIDLARLDARLKSAAQPMPLATGVFIVSEAARGLAYAHDKRAPDGSPLGIVHRDVSPQNLLLSYEGEVKVADFGIAKAAGKVHKTMTGVVMGKLRYMSPEQVAGHPLDARADLFSLGVIFYELLTGGPMFPELPGVPLAEQIHSTPIEPPSARNPSVPAALDGIALRLVARRREDRYARAQDAARDLSLFLNQHAPGFTREDLGTLVARLAPPAAPSSGTTPGLAPPALPRAASQSGSGSGSGGAPRTADIRSPAVARDASAFDATALSAATPIPGAAKPQAEIVPSEDAVVPVVPMTNARQPAPRQLDVATRTRLPDDSADGAAASAPPARRRSTFDDDPSRALPSERNRRRRGMSREAKISLALAGVILVSGGLVLMKFVLPGRQTAAVAVRHDAAPGAQSADAAVALPDSGALVPTGPFQLTPTIIDARARTALADRAERFDAARVGTISSDYAVFLTALDWQLATLTLDEQGRAEKPASLPPALERLVGERKLRPALDAVVEYVRQTGELPPRVKVAIKTAIKRGAFRAGGADASGKPGPAFSAAALGVWLAPEDPERLVDLARANASLERFCAPPPPPRRHFAPIGCELEPLIARLTEIGAVPTARVLERWRGATAAGELAGTLRLASATWNETSDGKGYRLQIRFVGEPPAGATFALLAGDLDVALRPDDAGATPAEQPLDAGPEASAGLELRFAVPRPFFAPVVQLDVDGQLTLFRLPAPPFPLFPAP